ncbi:hypothetical protein BV25DRAFT_1841623 [Artomyces pyxidatus]|uniref:Uncharacterized protein n=1 Tax=Artomyces pyxidatus TaxID=48021 RepID=A0ACB8SNR2_9AGAM|nr:hypothetical protein BV25DRAFT_1841623 [Artomyces pyxidatus]
MWTKAEHKTFLRPWLVNYRTYKNEGRLSFFWPDLYTAWFAKFPETEDGVIETNGKPVPVVAGQPQTMRNKLRNWVNNNHRKVLDQGGAASGSKKVLNLCGRATRRPTLSQVYQRLYWKKHLKPLVDPQYKAYEKECEKKGVKAQAELAWRNDYCLQILPKDSEEVKAAVHAAFAASGADTPLSVDEEGEESVGEGESVEPEGTQSMGEGRSRVASASVTRLPTETLNKYEKAIEALPRTVMTMLREIWQQTGWVGTFLVGGPQPGLGGNLQSFSAHTTMDNGTTFGKSLPQYSDRIEAPFVSFLEREFPPSVCARFALPGTTPSGGAVMSTSTALNTMPTAAAGQPPATGSADPAVPSTGDAEPTRPRTRKRPLNPLATAGANEGEDDEDEDYDEDDDEEEPLSKKAKQKALAPPVAPRESSRPGSAYERERAENIARNKALMKQLEIDGGFAALARQVDEEISRRAESTHSAASTTKPKPRMVTKTSEANKAAQLPGDKEIHVHTGEIGADGGGDSADGEGDNAGGGGGESTPDDGEADVAKTANGGDGDKTQDAPACQPIQPVSKPDGMVCDEDGRDPIPHDSVSSNNTSTDGPRAEELAGGSLNQKTSNEEEPVDEQEACSGTVGEVVAYEVARREIEDDGGDRSSERAFIKETLGVLEGACEEDDWRASLRLWCQLECMLGFPSREEKKNKLIASGRPKAMAFWLKRGRDYEKPPVIDDFSAYIDEFRAWWIELQPAWRGTEWPLVRTTPTGEEWEKTKRGGANGFVIALIMLSWGAGGKLEEGERRQMASMIEDVRWVLEAMVTGGPSTVNKRKSADEEGEGMNKKEERGSEKASAGDGVSLRLLRQVVSAGRAAGACPRRNRENSPENRGNRLLDI